MSDRARLAKIEEVVERLTSVCPVCATRAERCHKCGHPVGETPNESAERRELMLRGLDARLDAIMPRVAERFRAELKAIAELESMLEGEEE